MNCVDGWHDGLVARGRQGHSGHSGLASRPMAAAAAMEASRDLLWTEMPTADLLAHSGVARGCDGWKPMNGDDGHENVDGDVSRKGLRVSGTDATVCKKMSRRDGGYG